MHTRSSSVEGAIDGGAEERYNGGAGRPVGGRGQGEASRHTRTGGGRRGKVSGTPIIHVSRQAAMSDFVETVGYIFGPSHLSVRGASFKSILSFMLYLYVQGGNNAGHTVKVGSQAYDFHLLPRYVCYNSWHVHNNKFVFFFSVHMYTVASFNQPASQS